MDGWGRGDYGAVAEISMAHASRQPAISGEPDHSDRRSPTMVAPVLLLLPPLLCLLLATALPWMLLVFCSVFPTRMTPWNGSSGKVPLVQQQEEELHLQGQQQQQFHGCRDATMDGLPSPLVFFNLDDHCFDMPVWPPSMPMKYKEASSLTISPMGRPWKA